MFTVCLLICMSAFLYVSICCVLLYLYVCLSVSLSACVSVYLCICISTAPHFAQSVLQNRSVASHSPPTDFQQWTAMGTNSI